MESSKLADIAGNLCHFGGIALVGVGAGLHFDLGTGLMAGGALAWVSPILPLIVRGLSRGPGK